MEAPMNPKGACRCRCNLVFACFEPRHPIGSGTECTIDVLSEEMKRQVGMNNSDQRLSYA